MSKRHRISIIFIILCVLAVVYPAPRKAPCFSTGSGVYSRCFAATDAKKNVKEANRLYQKGKLDEALQKYNDVSLALPDSNIVNFNMGAALYKKEDYQKAIDSFTKALISEDKKLEADTLYNLGNCKYKLGKLKENTDLSTTAALLRESLDYYKRAVEIDQKNTDARFNHEFVERELNVLLDKLKIQQKSKKTEEQKDQGTEEQKQAPQEKQDNQQKQKTESKEDQEGEKRQSEESAQTKQEEKKNESASSEKLDRQIQEKEKSAQAKEEQQKEKQQEEGQAAKQEFQQDGRTKELSEDGARALLERYGREEAKPDYTDKRTHGYDSEVSKDW